MTGSRPMTGDLIERLEKAEGNFGGIQAWDLVPSAGFGSSGLKAELFADALQGSLDAALALAERLGMGAAYTLDTACQTTHKSQPTAHLRSDEGKHTGHARTMPLALCVAILKARTAAEADAVGEAG